VEYLVLKRLYTCPPANNLECKKKDWKFLSYLSEPLYTCRGLVEKSEEKNTLLKNIPVTILGAILAVDNNRLCEGLLSFVVISLKLVSAFTVK
jgi:hypothetical protein